MTRSEYYKTMQVLAREQRAVHGVTGQHVTRSDMRRIYKGHGITIDLWPYKLKGVRGAYFNDNLGPSVLLAKGLPTDPLVFTMAHELKHHLVDRTKGVALCLAGNQSEMVEIGAEVFAAEFLFPEPDFVEIMDRMQVAIGTCSAETLVQVKRDTRTTLSYAGLVKRAERLGFMQPGATAGVKWRALEERMFGMPVYKRIRRTPR